MPRNRNSTARGNDNGTVLLNITGSKTILRASVLKVQTHVDKTWFELLNDQCSLGVLSGVRVCSGNYSTVKRQGFMITNLNTTIGEFLSRFKRRLPKHAVVIRFASEQNLFIQSAPTTPAPSPQRTSQLSSIGAGRSQRHTLAAALSQSNATAPVGVRDLKDERGSLHRVPVFSRPSTLVRNESPHPGEFEVIGQPVASVNATENEQSIRRWLEQLPEEGDSLRRLCSRLDVDIESVYSEIINDEVQNGREDGETDSVVSDKTLVELEDLRDKGIRMDDIKARVKDNLENGFSNARLLLVIAELQTLTRTEVWGRIGEQAPETCQYLIETLLHR